MNQERQVLFERDEMDKSITRMAHEVIDKNSDAGAIVLIGIRSRGAQLARRMARKIAELTTVTPPVGVIDVTPFRDDRVREQGNPPAGQFEVPVAVDEKTVVLIDDVIFRGRTIRAAMEAVARLGQPQRILVAALVDRGERELPIRADIVGRNIEAGAEKRINVFLEEADGVDQITMTPWQARKAL